jgi:hypothetical protein
VFKKKIKLDTEEWLDITYEKPALRNPDLSMADDDIYVRIPLHTNFSYSTSFWLFCIFFLFSLLKGIVYSFYFVVKNSRKSKFGLKTKPAARCRRGCGKAETRYSFPKTHPSVNNERNEA